MLGRKIKNLENSYKDLGNHNLAWNGKDDFGKQVSAGVYIIKMNYYV